MIFPSAMFHNVCLLNVPQTSDWGMDRTLSLGGRKRVKECLGCLSCLLGKYRIPAGFRPPRQPVDKPADPSKTKAHFSLFTTCRLRCGFPKNKPAWMWWHQSFHGNPAAPQKITGSWWCHRRFKVNLMKCTWSQDRERERERVLRLFP